MDDREPLPCPFCGHVGLDFSDGSTYRWGLASCAKCGATCGEIRREYPDKRGWHAEAIAEWNKRTPAAANEAFKERLAQAIEQMPFGDTAASFAAFVRNFK